MGSSEKRVGARQRWYASNITPSGSVSDMFFYWQRTTVVYTTCLRTRIKGGTPKVKKPNTPFEPYRQSMNPGRRPLYDTTVFVFNRDSGLDRLEYVAGLQPSLWRRLPVELVNRIAEALGDLLKEPERHQTAPTALPLLHKTAITCRHWRQLYSAVLWRSPTLRTTTQVHSLEEIISSPLFSRLNYPIQDPRIHINSDASPDRFFSAWQSLSRHLPQVAGLEIAKYASNPLKSFSFRLRPCPRSLLHLKTLELYHVTFTSFSALFRDIGALPSLEQLDLDQVQWKGA